MTEDLGLATAKWCQGFVLNGHYLASGELDPYSVIFVITAETKTT
jgi:hypothetical protein